MPLHGGNAGGAEIRDNFIPAIIVLHHPRSASTYLTSFVGVVQQLQYRIRKMFRIIPNDDTLAFFDRKAFGANSCGHNWKTHRHGLVDLESSTTTNSDRDNIDLGLPHIWPNIRNISRHSDRLSSM